MGTRAEAEESPSSQILTHPPQNETTQQFSALSHGVGGSQNALPDALHAAPASSVTGASSDLVEAIPSQDVKSKEALHVSAAAFVEGGVQDACDDACSICLELFDESDPATVRPSALCNIMF